MKSYIKEGDCLELMKEIPDGAVDMILCDLPYGTTECSWDKRLSITDIWYEYRRIVKHNGVICLFGSEPFSTDLRTAARDLYKYDWIWIKNSPSGFQHAKNMPLKAHEIISVFSTGSIGHKSLLGEKRMVYNPQGLEDCYVVSKAGKNFGNIVGKRPSHKDTIVTTKTGYPKSVLYYNNNTGELSVANRVHPTQKPVDLLEYLIKTYTNEGEIVLDNCMGSGSTCIAAINTGRKYIGYELDHGYFETAKQRIAEAEEKHANGEHGE